MDATAIQEAKYKTQSILGAINDTFGVGIAKIRGDQSAELGVAVIKATRQDESVPKEKHVVTLLSACKDSPPAATLDFIILALFKRLEENKTGWLVTLKTLIVFHKLLREADPAFQVEVLRHGDGTGLPRLFPLEAFADHTTKDTGDYSLLIRVYSGYLDERLAAYRATRFDPCHEKSADEEETRLKSMAIADLLEYVAAVERLLGALTGVVPEGAAKTHVVTLAACTLVLQELLPVYSAANEAARTVVDRLCMMSKADAEKALELVKIYKALTTKLSGFIDSISTVPDLQGIVKLPTLEPLTEEAVSKVEEYAKNAPLEAPKPGAASPPSMADLLGFQSFIVQPKAAAAVAAAAAAAAGEPAAAGAPPAAAAAAASPAADAAAPPVAFDPFASFRAPPKPADPLDKVFGGALDALTLAVEQEVKAEKAAADSPAADAPSAPAAAGAPAASVPAAAPAAAESTSAALSAPDSAATPAVTVTAVTVTAPAEPYSLKPKDILDDLTKDLLGDRTPPPQIPMKSSMSGDKIAEAAQAAPAPAEATPAEPQAEAPPALGEKI